MQLHKVAVTVTVTSLFSCSLIKELHDVDYICCCCCYFQLKYMYNTYSARLQLSLSCRCSR